MSKLRWLCAVFCAVALLPVGAHAQEAGTVTGQVVDEATQRPLAGVQIFVAGTSRGTLTDQEGAYLIPNVPAGSQEVRATLIGYSQGEQQVTVVAGESVTADFSLSPSAVQLGGVVVNAITGEAQRVRELGTNTGNIDVTDIELAPITKMADLLTGRTAGVTLQGVSGTTGTSQRIRIRGANSLSLSNEPLIFVDGVRFSNATSGFGIGGQDPSRLNDIDPTDIATIEVLKGPAASALYGTAAANGVLLITTKRGSSGPANWNAYLETGVVEDVNDYPINIASFDVQTPGAPLIVDSTGAFNYGDYVFCPNYLAGAIDDETGQPVCTQDETFAFETLRDPRTTPFVDGYRQKYGLSVSGGGDQVTYFLSGDVEEEQGVIAYNTLNKVNLRANLGAAVTENFDVQLTSGYVNSGADFNNNDNSIFSPLINGLLGGVAFFPNPDPESDELNARNFGFGFSQDDLELLVINQDVDRFTVGLNSNYRPLPWLSANANVGMDYSNRHDYSTIQAGDLPIGGAYNIGFRQSQRANHYIYTANSSATATFDLTPDIVSTSTLGGSYFRDLFESTYCFGAGIVAGTRTCTASSSLFSVDEGFEEIITVGGFLQQQVALNDRVFLVGALRTDNNSAFGRDFGFVYYPSASLSWVVAEEPWFPEVGFLSTLRLRTAYGTSGLRPEFRDAITFFEPVAVQVEGEELSAVTLDNTGNVNLEPERTTEYEFGFDAGVLQDRLSVDFTYYSKTSRDALVRRPLPPSFGLTSTVFDNLGSIRNSGTEIGLNAQVLNLNDARLDLRITATTLDNEILDLGDDIEPIIINRGEQRHQEGFPAGAFFQPPITYDDANNDGYLSRDEVSIDADAFTVVPDGAGGLDTLNVAYIGPSLPTFSRTLAGNLTLFDFVTVSTLFDWRGGNYQLNGTEGFRCGVGVAFQDRGCPATGDPNASLEEQAAFIGDTFLGTAAGYIEEADFVKWRELSVTLGVPATLSRYLPAAEGASLTLSGRNLKTWTDYSGIDPEINEQGSTNFNQNEFNTQPPVRYFTARLNFTF